ncbi:hypothetical protein NHI66_003256, partial [Clostridium botulinum]|nr:hypothetical protein [Clostridium botulinum]
TGPTFATVIGEFNNSTTSTTPVDISPGDLYPITTSNLNNTVGAFSLTNNTVTVNESGIYLVEALVLLNSNSSGGLAIQQNGSTAQLAQSLFQNTVPTPVSGEITIFSVLNISADDDITLINHLNTRTASLQIAFDGNGPTNVTLRLTKIS